MIVGGLKMNPQRALLYLLPWVFAVFGGLLSCVGAQSPEDYKAKRLEMVSRQIQARGVRHSGVLEAMRTVPRHLFIPEEYTKLAYADRPLPIGHRQTISQPYVVAYMTEALNLKGHERVLEIGTGSGYQAAVLSLLVQEVYTIEIVKPLADAARERLEEMGYSNIHVKWGDGYKGWPEEAPFDAVIVTAAPPEIPEALVDQMRVGGRMVVPVGNGSQDLLRVTKTEDGIRTETMLPVLFVPMVPGEDMEDHER
jgi:protein-L-isoaspartate(D-aspartate) O-methyltransferase